MNENLFDNYIKDKLHEYESPVPEGLWDKIVADKDRKKPLPFWKNGYFQSAFFGLVIVGLLSSGYLVTRNNNTFSNNNRINKANITVTKTLGKASGPSEVAKIKAVSFASNKDDKEEDKKLGSAIVKKHAAVMNNSSVVTERADNYNKAEKKELARVLAVNRFKEAVPVLISNNSRAVTSTISNILAGEQNANTSVLMPVVKEIMTDDAIENSISHLFVNGDIVLTESDLLNEKTVKTTLQSANKTPTTIHLPNLENKGWFVELYASPDYDMKHVSAGGGLNTGYLHTQDSANKSIGGFTAGFRISKGIGNNFSLKSGVQFKESTERFRYVKQNDVKNISVMDTRSYTDNSGATVYQNDTSVIQQVGGYTLRTVINTYKSIEIPLIASWEKGNNKWHVAVNGGVILNLFTFYEGQTFDNSYSIVLLSAKQSSGFFRSTANCSLYGSLSLLRNIGKGMNVFAEPYYRYALGNNSTSAIGYDQRFNSAGINFGIRYKIPTHKSIK